MVADDVLARVFEMLVERVGQLEGKLGKLDAVEKVVERTGQLEEAATRRDAAERERAEWALKGTYLPAALFGGPPSLGMLKAWTKMPATSPNGPSYYCITSYITGDLPEYATEEWAAGKLGELDADLEEAWGSLRVASVREQLKRWYVERVVDENGRLPEALCEELEACRAAEHHESVENEILEAVLRVRVSKSGMGAYNLVAWTHDGCVIEVFGGAGVMGASADVLRLASDMGLIKTHVRQLVSVLMVRRADVAAAFFADNRTRLQEKWASLSQLERRTIVEDDVRDEDGPVFTMPGISSMLGEDWGVVN